ncbi:aromatic acid exporter family protein [Blastococcus montanus]|uniref:aromatic acid exporter family protein n=1 Tax=Blastococcus montanus TaxID=3144973 RepID=UPI0032098161
MRRGRAGGDGGDGPAAALRVWDRHPRVVLALKTALAAGLAWALAQSLPAPLDDYPFYAPLGAVVTSSITLVGSVRESAEILLALVLGAVIGVVLTALPVPNLLSLAVAVAVGMVLSGWHRLGDAGSWVPTSAFFVLIFGGSDPTGYVLELVGLVLLGALVGLGVTAAFPPLPLAPAQTEIQRLRGTLAGQLAALADGLRRDHPPTRHEWRDRMRAIDPVLGQMRSAVQQAEEARRGNRRARKHQQDAERLYEEARALENLALLVEVVTRMIAETEVADRRRVALGPALRPPAAEALARLGEVLGSTEASTADPDTTRGAYAALHRLTDQLRAARRQTDDDLFAASSIVEAIRRCLAAVVPQELAEEEDRARTVDR